MTDSQPTPRAGLAAGYSEGQLRPLGSYAVLTAVFGAASAAFLASRRDQLPERIGAADLLLIAGATHKLSRLIAKDRVTSFLRAPFTRYTGESSMPGEVSEEARGSGLQLAVGELLICPYCMGQWVVATLGAGLVVSPRTTRLVAAVSAALGMSDFLQLAYAAAEKKALS